MLVSITTTVVVSDAPVRCADQHAHHVGVLREILVPRAVSGGVIDIGGIAPKPPARVLDDRGAGRSGEFDLRAARVDRLADQQVGRRGRRNRQDAMLGTDGAAAHIDRAAVHRVDTEVVEAEARADDVADRVNGADLVEVDLLDSGRVHLRLGLGEAAKHGERIGLHTVGQARSR